MTAATGRARPLRADAARNRRRVVAAAEAVFAERGLGASIDDVAARAGVGRATIYRNFPTKDDLIGGIAIERLRRFAAQAEAACAEPDAGTAFRRLLLDIADTRAQDRVMIDALRLEASVPAVGEARAAAAAALDRLMARAKRQGTVRRDATAEDVRVLITGVAHALAPERQGDRAAWRRYATLIADALAA